MIRAAFLLLTAGLILAFASLRYGAVLQADWYPCELALGVILLLGYHPFGESGESAPVNPVLCVCLLAIPALALLQAVPVPASWVGALSPGRMALANPLLRFAPAPTRLPLSIRPDETLRYALRYLAFAATFLMTRDLMWRLPGRQWLIALPPLCIALFEAGIGVLQNSAGVATNMVSGTFMNRNHFSAMLEMCLPFALCGVFDFAPEARRALIACGGAVTATLLLTGIGLSLSRTGYFIALLVVLLMVWLHAMTRLRGAVRVFAVIAGLLTVVASGIALASGMLLERMASPANTIHSDVPFTDRLLFWKETMHVMAAYPIFGCGFGAFVSAVTPWRAAAVTRTLDYAHNDYLQFVAEGGILAALFAIPIAVIVTRSIWRGVFRQRRAERRGFAIACGVAVVAGALHSAVDLITYVPATGMLLCWFVGMAAGLEFDQTP